MRRAKSLVAVFDLYGKTHCILYPEAAPGGADAAFDRPQRLAVGVAALEARRDEFLPDGGQVADVCPEQVDALTARDFGVKAVLLGHGSNDDQLFGRDLTARNPWYHGVGTAFLNIGQKAVVGILHRSAAFFQDVLVPQTG